MTAHTRDPYRELAEEIVKSIAYWSTQGAERWNEPFRRSVTDHWEARLRSALPSASSLLGELAVARDALEGVDQVCKDSFRDAGTVENHRTVPICPLCAGEAVCDEECPAPDVRRALDFTVGRLAGEVLGVVDDVVHSQPEDLERHLARLVQADGRLQLAMDGRRSPASSRRPGVASPSCPTCGGVAAECPDCEGSDHLQLAAHPEIRGEVEGE